MDEERKVYTIPANISDDGNVINGWFKKRNLIEAVIVFIIMFFIWSVFTTTFNLYIKAGTFIFVLIPTIIALIGIKDKSLLEFVIITFYFHKKKRQMVFRMPRQNVEKKKEK